MDARRSTYLHGHRDSLGNKEGLDCMTAGVQACRRRLQGSWASQTLLTGSLLDTICSFCGFCHSN